MYYLEVFVIEGYDKHFETLEQLVSYSEKEGFSGDDVIYKKRYNWLHKKYELIYLCKVYHCKEYRILHLNDRRYWKELELEDIGGGFQNSGVSNTDGYSGFRG